LAFFILFFNNFLRPERSQSRSSLTIDSDTKVNNCQKITKENGGERLSPPVEKGKALTDDWS
jgi:hypothetical protein